MTEGKVVSWVKSEGDKLSKGESVVVVESDKADMDVETFYDGYLAAIMVDEGGVAPVGSAIALLAESEDEISLAKSKATDSGSSSSSSDLVEAHSQPQATIPEPEAPKVTLAVDSASVSVVSTHPAATAGRVVASPYAKKLAKDLKVELKSVVGSGPMGRIVAKDVESAAVNGSPAPAPASVANPNVRVSGDAGVELGSTVPFTTMQAAVSRNMVESLVVPTFRVGYTITTDALDQLYKKVFFFPFSSECFLFSD